VKLTTQFALILSIALVPLVAIISIVGERGYYFLYWNLILAAIPMTFAYLASLKSGFAWVWLAPWIAFLPNSFYVWTDIIHPFGVIQYYCPKGNDLLSCDQELIRQIVAPRWDGTVVQMLEIIVVVYCIALSAWFGMLAWNQVIKRYQPAIASRLLIVFVPVCAFAITLGRFARTNSWYLLTHPLRVIDDSITTIKNILTSGIHAGTFLISCVWIIGTILGFGYIKKRLDHTNPHNSTTI
jgi:uncharacterized membrane protein